MATAVYNWWYGINPAQAQIDAKVQQEENETKVLIRQIFDNLQLLRFFSDRSIKNRAHLQSTTHAAECLWRYLNPKDPHFIIMDPDKVVRNKKNTPFHNIKVMHAKPGLAFLIEVLNLQIDNFLEREDKRKIHALILRQDELNFDNAVLYGTLKDVRAVTLPLFLQPDAPDAPDVQVAESGEDVGAGAGAAAGPAGSIRSIRLADLQATALEPTAPEATPSEASYASSGSDGEVVARVETLADDVISDHDKYIETLTQIERIYTLYMKGIDSVVIDSALVSFDALIRTTGAQIDAIEVEWAKFYVDCPELTMRLQAVRSLQVLEHIHVHTRAMDALLERGRQAIIQLTGDLNTLSTLEYRFEESGIEGVTRLVFDVDQYNVALASLKRHIQTLQELGGVVKKVDPTSAIEKLEETLGTMSLELSYELTEHYRQLITDYKTYRHQQSDVFRPLRFLAHSLGTFASEAVAFAEVKGQAATILRLLRQPRKEYPERARHLEVYSSGEIQTANTVLSDFAYWSLRARLFTLGCEILVEVRREERNNPGVNLRLFRPLSRAILPLAYSSRTFSGLALEEYQLMTNALARKSWEAEGLNFRDAYDYKAAHRTKRWLYLA